MIYPIVLFCLGFAFLAYHRINWATALVVFSLPFYLIRFSIFNLPATLLEAMIVVLFVVWLYKQLKEKKKFSLSNYRALILFFLIITTLSLINSDNLIPALGIWKAYFVEPILFFIVLINTLKKRKELFLLVNSLVASTLFISIYAVIQKFIPIGIENSFWAAEETRRVVSWYGFPNAIGLYLAPVLILMIGFFIYDFWLKEKITVKFVIQQIYLALAIVLSGLAIYFAQSEGAIVAVVVGLGFLGLILPIKWLRISTVVVCVLAVTVLFTQTGLQEKVWQKITLNDLSGQIRLAMWGDTWRMLSDGRIVNGAGLANYQAVVKPYHQEGIFFNKFNDPDFHAKTVFDAEYRAQVWQPYELYLYPHNVILNFWSELGLFGLLATILLILALFKNYFKVKNKENRFIYRILLIVMIVILIHGVVDVPYFKNDLSVLWWILFALSFCLTKQNNILKEK